MLCVAIEWPVQVNLAKTGFDQKQATVDPWPVQVHRGQLDLAASTQKQNLLGFADLCPEGDKTLLVLYQYRGGMYEVEGAPLRPGCCSARLEHLPSCSCATHPCA